MSSDSPVFYSRVPSRGGLSPNRNRRFLLDYSYEPYAYEFTALPPAEHLTFASYFKEDDGFIENPDMYAARIGAEVINMIAHRSTFMENLEGAEMTKGDFSS
jgi:hypothetical protein